MGIVREPEGVDFIIQSPPLTDKEKKKISEFIKMRKEENKVPALKKLKAKLKA